MPDTSASDALNAVMSHPLCQTYLETPTRYVVFYPSAYKIPGGAAVQKSGDVVADLTLLYQRMENFWQVQRLQVAKT